MHDRSPEPISASEFAARVGRIKAIARGLGFVGAVEYRHSYGQSGGAQYGMATTIDRDALIVDAGAFERDAAEGDFSLQAMIAHERGHQLLCRHERLRRNLPRGMSVVTEEVLASLVGACISTDADASQNLILKALSELVGRGMPTAEAVRRVKSILTYLGAVL